MTEDEFINEFWANCKGCEMHDTAHTVETERMREMYRKVMEHMVLQVSELQKEVARQHGEPFTCGHEPKYAGGACAVCHVTWIERAEVAERLNREAMKACPWATHDVDHREPKDCINALSALLQLRALEAERDKTEKREGRS